jgi:hypothetical protein
MTNTNPPKERGTAHSDSDPERIRRCLLEILAIAERNVMARALREEFIRRANEDEADEAGYCLERRIVRQPSRERGRGYCR